MRTFLLVMITILLILRIKGTPRLLSKEKYLSAINESLIKVKSQETECYKGQIEMAKTVTLLFAAIMQIATGVIYLLLQAKINIPYFTILTVIQLLTVIYTGVTQINMGIFDPEIENHKFHRWYFLFNVILDYIYYPLAFYLLIK